jgi:uncharacterized tellurite resistance protein B-like protein
VEVASLYPFENKKDERLSKMMDVLRRLFRRAEPKGSPESREVPLKDVHTATCALFLEMANIDGEFSESEQNRILSLLKRDYLLSDEDALRLMEATNQELAQSIDLWQFTRIINQSYSNEEKMHIIQMLWKIVYADGTLDKHERYLVDKLSKLLRLSHQELIDAKMSALGKGNP